MRAGRVGRRQELEDDAGELDELEEVLDDVPALEEGAGEAASDFFAEPSPAPLVEVPDVLPEPEDRESLR